MLDHLELTLEPLLILEKLLTLTRLPTPAGASDVSETFQFASSGLDAIIVERPWMPVIKLKLSVCLFEHHTKTTGLI